MRKECFQIHNYKRDFICGLTLVKFLIVIIQSHFFQIHLPKYLFKIKNVLVNNISLLLDFSIRWNKVPNSDAMGSFELLLDEELAYADENQPHKKTSNFRWK